MNFCSLVGPVALMRGSIESYVVCLLRRKGHLLNLLGLSLIH